MTVLIDPVPILREDDRYIVIERADRDGYLVERDPRPDPAAAGVREVGRLGAVRRPAPEDQARSEPEAQASIEAALHSRWR
jgi:hypothetical protein